MPPDAQGQLEHELRIILVAISLVFAAAVIVYWALIKRWTSHRRWVALSDWARAHRFHLRQASGARLPPALATTTSASVQPVIALHDSGETSLLQVDSSAAAPDAGAQRWNVLARTLQTAWPPTALRPVAAANSLVDLYKLEAFPVFGHGERFLVCGADKSAARVLAHASVRGLLPADIGLILIGNEMLLDFSARPFDEIEFQRVMSVADQVVANLPSLATAPTSS